MKEATMNGIYEVYSYTGTYQIHTIPIDQWGTISALILTILPPIIILHITQPAQSK